LEGPIRTNIPPTALLLLAFAGFPVAAQEQSIEDLIQSTTERQPLGGEAVQQVPSATTAVPTAPSVAAEEAEPTMADLDVEAVNAAAYTAEAESVPGSNALILKTQILLDRAGASPGVIDSYYGENVAKAIAAVETVLQLPVDGRLDPQVWAALGGDNKPAVLVRYTITEADMAGPFVPDIPADFSEQARLKRLAYTGPQEMFSERFHMDVDLLAALNPDIDFNQPGSSIVVAAVDGPPIVSPIVRIDVDKTLKQLRAYDAGSRLLVAYPASIGSDENPSPSGTHAVDAVVQEPFYNYDPENFVQGDNDQKLTLPPGPNNPVGIVWIGLTERGYGIHGTPAPSRIDKTGSHVCIRLTNWDAEELAELVQRGVVVTFLE
jgi:lipoprotein-anchoring transpeptidase ErfK/SrfK